ncbi:helix-turn-helix domain-containing protein [Algoriphagus aestuariicola]|uniref:Helix-turn-helix domain-containing protein n=1 Tax=Algoriphagus aestuariicola TaxID=1852016 RepID=A0ABS3BXL3_9BACT|nr:helix-turn-helix domain-containing protein [Algoriphagus aestuariicola]MBN7803554.1 helix-turn-helix domain-containing protein [Algoriphagus aestuariicola]
MTFNSHIPLTSSHLSDSICMVWEVQGQSNLRETILPKGVIELIFNLGDGIAGTLPGDKNIQAPPCFIQGIATQVIRTRYAGQHHLFGVQLKPSMLRNIFGFEGAEFKNNLVDLTLIKASFLSLWHQLMEAGSFEKRIQVIEAEFPLVKKTDCIRTKKMCSLFFSNGVEGFESVEAFASAINYSPRQVNRKAHSLFGISGEELITYKKYLQSVNLIHSGRHTLSEVAYESGFFDQAHFCKKFRMFSGITAREYISLKSQAPFHIFS